jgi:hypothetical protein
MTQKKRLWTQIYIEALKKHDRPLLERDIDKAESAATQAVKAFERRFEVNEKDKKIFPELYRLKRLFEEMKFDIECEDNEGLATIKVQLTYGCIIFDFKDGVYQKSYLV